MNFVKLAHQLVKEECAKPTSHYKGIFKYHIVPMVRIAQNLARKLGANQEVVVAAWLHDIGSILLGRKLHQISGAAIAEYLLRAWGYPEEKVQQVKDCILCHRGSDEDNKPETLEARIVAEADALSAIHNISGLYKGAFDEEKKDEGEAKISVRNKLKAKFNQLTLPGTKESAQAHFDALMFVLD